MPSLTYALFRNIVSDLAEIKDRFDGRLDNHFSVIQFDAKAGYEDAKKENSQTMSKSAGA